jgi:hypothetical protein
VEGRSPSAEHRVLIKKRRGEDGRQWLDLVIETHGGPCPGHLVIRRERVSKHAATADQDRAHLEHLAYVLAKQIEANGLDGVSDHVQGHWLLWRAGR